MNKYAISVCQIFIFYYFIFIFVAANHFRAKHVKEEIVVSPDTKQLMQNSAQITIFPLIR